MPSIPPPPPPVVDEESPVEWPGDMPCYVVDALRGDVDQEQEPHAVALFDYFTDHPDDLCFSVTIIFLP